MSKVSVVLNGVDGGRFAPGPPDDKLLDSHDLRGQFVVGYLGTHGMAHALEKVIDAATLLRDRTGIVFIFAGAGAKRGEVEALVRERALPNVRLIDSQPRDAMPALWSVHDVALIPLRDQPLFRTVIPSKMFEAIGMGVPIVMSVPAGEATRLLEAAGAGVCVAPEDPVALAKALVMLAEDPAKMTSMRQACLRAAPTYSRCELARAMLAVLERAATRDRVVA